MNTPQFPSYSLRQLLYFVTVAEYGTIRAAAQRLHVAESAVSAALTEFERALGAQLLVRRRAHGVALTPSGRSTLRLAKAVLRQVQELEVHASGLPGELRGALSIGCYAMLGPTTLVPLLADFSALYRGVSIGFAEDAQDSLLRRLASGELDVAIMYDVDLPPDLPRVTLDRRTPYVLLPETHRLSGRRLSLRELASEPMVLHETPFSTSFVHDLCARAGVRPTIRYRTETSETARSLVGRGLGWSLFVTLPKVQATYEGLGLGVGHLENPEPEPVGVVLAWQDTATLSRQARAFSRFARGDSADDPR